MDYSTNFGMKLPRRGVDMAKVDDLNDNTETIDTIMHQNRTMLGKAYDSDKVGGYTEGDFVVQLGQYYECLDDTSGTWDPTKWQLTDIGTVLKALANNGGGHIYSTTERIVGKWTDGKDIYEITFILQNELTLTANQWNSITGVTLSNVDTPIGVEIRGSRGTSAANVDFFDTPVSVWGASGTEKIKSITFQYTKSSS